MEQFRKIEEIGRGAYGIVWKAINKQTNEVVAIKKLFETYYTIEECINLREVKSLIKMKNHPNIVSLKQIIRQNDTLFLVFEYMERDLYKTIQDRIMKPFKETEIRDMCFQVFKGLAYMHSNGYFHRDIKPGNILVSKDVIKICDLGQAKEINGEPPYTPEVSTLWYRAPEVFLDAPVYNSAVDMWAIGAIMVELFTLEPLFKGDLEIDVMYKICSVLGTPTKSTWDRGLDLARKINYEFPKDFLGVKFSKLLPNASSDVVDLIVLLLLWDPNMRPTAIETLQHPFFDGCYNVPKTVFIKKSTTRSLESGSSGSETIASREDPIKFFTKRVVDPREDSIICSQKIHNLTSKM
uniref:cyclin-dependent kinase F-4-like n=1 Tax=Erigeron canadensis TaxID=72917 RepID=UPI001CB957D4|nr:cyclin-dependent kinase F-4-like [Erigeron canadensis]